MQNGGRREVSALPRQPGGFEGVGHVGEAIDSHDEPIPKGEQGWELALDLDPVSAAEAPHVTSEDPVACRLQPFFVAARYCVGDVEENVRARKDA